MGQTGRRSIATHILAVKIVSAVALFHSFGVARQGPWVTWVNKGKRRKGRSLVRLVPPHSRPLRERKTSPQQSGQVASLRRPCGTPTLQTARRFLVQR